MKELSGRFTYRRLLKFTFPSIIMLVVTSVYVVIDGLFVSNYVGKGPFAAINFIWPFLQILGSLGFLFGTGGSALIARTLGEGKKERANQIFSMLVYAALICGVVLTILGLLLLRPVAAFMGARGALLEDSVLYGTVYLLGLTPCLLQYAFQCLCASAGRPRLGLYATVAAGVVNILMDYLLVAVFSWGLAGAAAASTLSMYIGGLVPLIYFACPNGSLLHLTKTKFLGREMLQICSNGFSELLNNISMSIVGALYNYQLLRYIGADGVAAYGVLLYVNLIFLSIFIGYTVGVAPVVSFQYGAQNLQELKKLLKKSLIIIGVSSVVMFAASELLARPLSLLYTSYDPGLMQVTLRGFFLYSFSFLFSGFAILGSSFFTALSNGLVSALLSFLRTMVFQVAFVLVFPAVWQEDGIWLSVVAAEFLAALAAFLFLLGQRKKYGYFE